LVALLLVMGSPVTGAKTPVDLEVTASDGVFPRSNITYVGTAELLVLGTHNHETITLYFDETSSRELFFKGEGDTSHTITFTWCGPMPYIITAEGSDEYQLTLDKSWTDVPCTAQHHLPKKMKNVKVKYRSTVPDVLEMTADVYTVWPIGWMEAKWHMVRDDAPPPSSAQMQFTA